MINKNVVGISHSQLLPTSTDEFGWWQWPGALLRQQQELVLLIEALFPRPCGHRQLAQSWRVRSNHFQLGRG